MVNFDLIFLHKGLEAYMKYAHPLGLTATRRTFLKVLTCAGVAAVWAGLPGCAPDGKAPSDLTFLDASTYGVIRALAERVIPAGGAFPEGADDVDVVRYFDSIVSAQPPEIQKDMKSGILLLEYRALFFRLSFKRFTEMTPDTQDAYLRSWETSSIPLFRGVFWGFKKICCLGFFSNEKIWPRIAYDGRWIS